MAPRTAGPAPHQVTPRQKVETRSTRLSSGRTASRRLAKLPPAASQAAVMIPRRTGPRASPLVNHDFSLPHCAERAWRGAVFLWRQKVKQARKKALCVLTVSRDAVIMQAKVLTLRSCRIDKPRPIGTQGQESDVPTMA